MTREKKAIGLSLSEAPIPWAEELGGKAGAQLATYLGSLLTLLDSQLDVRLVRTFAATVVNIIRPRDRTPSLLLPELGELLTDGAHAPIEVKRPWRLNLAGHWIWSGKRVPSPDCGPQVVR